MNEPVLISFEGVAKRYDLRVIFRGVSGKAGPGEIQLITGPNGSGKSTLLTILCGLLRPTRGQIRYSFESGEEIHREDWRRYIGVVAPSMAVYEELSAFENLGFFAKVRGMAKDEAHWKDCLERVGLDPERTTLARGFSTGMLQRLKIAQALLHSPPVLFLDEPGSNLDPSGQDWLESWVLEEKEAGTTIVLATNDRREMTWGDEHVALSQ